MRCFIPKSNIIPTVFSDAKTVEEQIYYIYNYINDVLIPANNDNVEAIQELQNMINTLQPFVNNKLDEMYEDGKFSEMFAEEVLQTITDRIAALEDLNISDRLEEVESDVENCVTTVNNMSSDVDDLKDINAGTRLNTIEGNVDVLTTNVTNLNSAVNTIVEANLPTRVNNLETTVSNQGNQIVTNTTNIQTNTSHIGDVSELPPGFRGMTLVGCINLLNQIFNSNNLDRYYGSITINSDTTHEGLAYIDLDLSFPEDYIVISASVKDSTNDRFSYGFNFDSEDSSFGSAKISCCITGSNHEYPNKLCVRIKEDETLTGTHTYNWYVVIKEHDLPA